MCLGWSEALERLKIPSKRPLHFIKKLACVANVAVKFCPFLALFDHADIGTRVKNKKQKTKNHGGGGGEGREGRENFSLPLPPFFRSRPNFHAVKQPKTHKTPLKRLPPKLSRCQKTGYSYMTITQLKIVWVLCAGLILNLSTKIVLE